MTAPPMSTRPLHPHVSSTLRATREGTIPAGVTDDAMTGAALRGQVVGHAATDPLSYTPVKRQMLRPQQATVIRTISRIDPLVRSQGMQARSPFYFSALQSARCGTSCMEVQQSALESPENSAANGLGSASGARAGGNMSSLSGSSWARSGGPAVKCLQHKRTYERTRP